MTLTFDIHLDSVNLNQYIKYQNHLFQSLDTQTHETDCFTWATTILLLLSLAHVRYILSPVRLSVVCL